VIDSNLSWRGDHGELRQALNSLFVSVRTESGSDRVKELNRVIGPVATALGSDTGSLGTFTDKSRNVVDNKPLLRYTNSTLGFQNET